MPIWILYILITILLTLPFYWQVYRSGGSQAEHFERSLRRLIIIPGVVALGFRLGLGRGLADLNFGLGKNPGLWFPVALLLPLAVELLVITLGVVFKLARLDPRIITIKARKFQVSPNVRLLLGNDPQPFAQLLLNLFVTVAVGALVSLVFSFGEEFGWRGFLMGEMIPRFGPGSGLFFLGIGWAAWYGPLVWMGYRFPEARKMGALLYMPLLLISIGMVSGFLYWISGSLWVPALFNAATQVTSVISPAALGRDAQTGRMRFVLIWLWGILAGLFISLWSSGLFGDPLALPGVGF